MSITSTTTRPSPSTATGTVRPATTPGDWVAAATLLRDYIGWIEATSGICVFAAQPDFETEIDDLARVYSRPTAELFIADDGGDPCGTVAVRLDDGGAAEIKRMYVDPSRRGRGHAGRLLRTALAWAERAGADRAWLETLPGIMDPAIDLYRRVGFGAADTAANVDVDSAIVMTRPLGPQPVS